MSASDPFAPITTTTPDPTTGVSFPDPSQIPLQLPPWLVAILNQNVGQPSQGLPASGSSSSGPGVGSTIAGLGLNALGTYLNYQANQARNNLLQQQIQSGNIIAQADQARRDYYASVLMPHILQGLRETNPSVIQGAQGALQQSKFPTPLQLPNTAATTYAAAPASTTPTTTTPPAQSGGAAAVSGGGVTSPDASSPANLTTNQFQQPSGGGNIDAFGNPIWNTGY